ncbi:pollen receptor-like kinase 4 [Silene latifolia]|uniref:pollen receptor-like kinase 4 n=1 Tax=Silene latifolia TaxID=37657 RepID=UPI003D76B77E
MLANPSRKTQDFRVKNNNVVFIVIVFLAIIILVQVDIVSCDDAQTLLKFKESLTNATALNSWNISIPPCTNGTRNWVGVLCGRDNVTGLQLEMMGLQGDIDMDSLAEISSLRSISLMNNSFNGPMPPIKKLERLRALFLSGNNFSGDIKDDAFKGMDMLRKVYLANNSFSGVIPTSLAELPLLLELSIANNEFSGNIPNFVSETWRLVDLTNNAFVGDIPSSFTNLNSSSFLGNPGLCGKPLAPCILPPEINSGNSSLCGQPSTPPCKPKAAPSNSHAKLIIIIITFGLLFIISIIFMFTRNKNNKMIHQNSITMRDIERLPNEKHNKKQSNGSELYQNNQSRGLERPTSYKKSDNGKLIFLRNDRQKFEMQDLLKASAEVLGSGSFGSSYKAAIVGGHTFVVKRFRQMNNVGKEEFQEHMKRLGKLRHTNILPLVAFFHKRDEKLIISDFVDNGSLASHLHGRRTEDQPGLEWSTRLKIIKGVARGLAYLYRELPQLALPHGHLKSSNVLLDDSFEPLLSDYALAPLINKDHAEQVMVGYKSPEFIQTNESTKKTDVWCLGILILEILTGKFPANYLKPGKGGNDDLSAWVNSVVKEESTSEMFDMEMKASRSSKGEMLKLLKVGVSCCEWNVDKRWSLREAVQKIEELKERDNDDEVDFPSYGSGRELYSTISSISEENVSFRN